MLIFKIFFGLLIALFSSYSFSKEKILGPSDLAAITQDILNRVTNDLKKLKSPLQVEGIDVGRSISKTNAIITVRLGHDSEIADVPEYYCEAANSQNKSYAAVFYANSMVCWQTHLKPPSM